MCCWHRQLAAVPSLYRLQMFHGFCWSGLCHTWFMQYHRCSGEISFSALMRPSHGGKGPVLKTTAPPPPPHPSPLCSYLPNRNGVGFSSHLPFHIISSPPTPHPFMGMLFCNTLAVSHAWHRSEFPPGCLMHRSPLGGPALRMCASDSLSAAVGCLLWQCVCLRVCSFCREKKKKKNLRVDLT